MRYFFFPATSLHIKSHVILYSSLLTNIFFIFLVNSFLGMRTVWSQPSHLMRMSIPIRTTFHLFVPHGCAFFISTTSFKPNSLSVMFLHSLLFYLNWKHARLALVPGYRAPGEETEFQFPLHPDDF